MEGETNSRNTTLNESGLIGFSLFFGLSTVSVIFPVIDFVRESVGSVPGLILTLLPLLLISVGVPYLLHENSETPIANQTKRLILVILCWLGAIWFGALGWAMSPYQQSAAAFDRLVAMENAEKELRENTSFDGHQLFNLASPAEARDRDEKLKKVTATVAAYKAMDSAETLLWREGGLGQRNSHYACWVLTALFTGLGAIGFHRIAGSARNRRRPNSASEHHLGAG
jgi:hypothetical protein